MAIAADALEYGLESLAAQREKLIRITSFLDDTVRSARRRGRAALADRCALHGEILRLAITGIERR
ncbi:MAG: hypothetical protein JO255_08365, partial [Alphaproteobacteria bacterium]|nr:hypothetical protein [Alphaproteobacteria bacterium]